MSRVGIEEYVEAFTFTPALSRSRRAECRLASLCEPWPSGSAELGWTRRSAPAASSPKFSPGPMRLLQIFFANYKKAIMEHRIEIAAVNPKYAATFEASALASFASLSATPPAGCSRTTTLAATTRSPSAGTARPR